MEVVQGHPKVDDLVKRCYRVSVSGACVMGNSCEAESWKCGSVNLEDGSITMRIIRLLVSSVVYAGWDSPSVSAVGVQRVDELKLRLALTGMDHQRCVRLISCATRQ